MSWGAERTAKGVVEREFSVEVEGRRIPAVFWRPDGEDDVRALVMLGHGGGADKRAPYLLAIGRWLVRDHGIGAFAIDGPGHGERLPQGAEADFEAAWGSPDATDAVIADWRGALDFVRTATGDVPLGYWGLSMGTMMGLPVAAALDEVRAALLGLMGLWGPNADRLEADAPRLTCPVRFLVQWDDEIVPRDRALELFTRIGSAKKTLHGNPGLHVEVPPAEMRDSTAFLARHLTE